MESSAAPSRGPASFLTQANALLRKNLCFQKRNLKTNIGITLFPVLLCVILVVLQGVINRELDKPKYRCGCSCVDPGPTAVGDACRRTECGVQYSTLDQVGSCPIPSPTPWPALVQLPRPESRAVNIAGQPFDGLPNPTCRDTGSCPATVLFTGNNQSLAESLSGGLFPSLTSSFNFTNYLDALSKIVAGSDTWPWTTELMEPVFIPGNNLYLVQPRCLSNLSQTVSSNAGAIPLQLNVDCVQGLSLWRESASVVNDELFKGYRQRDGGSGEGKTNEFVAGYDFANTNRNSLEMNIWYNSTYNNNTAYVPISLLRVPRLVNTASNAYIKFLRGSGVEMLLEYVKEMPKVGTKQKFDLSSLLGPLFFTWIVELLFPVSVRYDAFLKDSGKNEGWILVMEIIPGFSLYRGLYEFGQYAFAGNAMGTDGMKWTDLDDPLNGMRSVLIIMVVEWAILLPLAFYVDQVLSVGGGFHRNPLFFLKYFKKRAQSLRRYSFGRQGSRVVVEMDNPDTVQEAVDDSLKSVNLFHGGVGDKQVGKYSGGMKRRLSVAISLIGDPKLKARYGGTYVLTMTTSSENEQEVEQLVHRLSPNASRIYHISGTQKFELLKQELKIADVFHAVESAKSRFSIYAWGLVDTTLEDVFIKVAKGAQAFSVVA
nr:unnamed protein product [Digitaria exilis]